MMSKFTIVFFLIMGSGFLFQGCFDPPEFPLEPKISYKSIEYSSQEGPDSLILTFNFEDGDGDIGLSSDETFPPYHNRNFIIDSSNPPRFVTFDGTDYTLPFRSVNLFDTTRTFFSDQDNRPDYNCLNYEYFDSLALSYIYLDPTTANRDSIIFLSDTLYVVANEFNKNIYVDMYRKSLGEYTNINLEFSRNQQCPETFNARFPIFDNRNIGRALSGSITYAMISSGFETVFRNDSIMIEFYIYDRDLNRSNIARTPDFILSDITKN